jgi:hypothetical protein
MKGYGFQGEMNPQTEMKSKMSNSSSSKKYKGKMKENPGKGKGSHDMSPKIKSCKEEAVWQNMRG